MQPSKYIWFLLLYALAYTATGQNSACQPAAAGVSSYTGSVFFNYGSQANAVGPKNRTALTVGEPAVGTFFGQNNSGALGFYSRYLLPPFAPTVFASEGDLTDRIQVEWIPDPLSPFAEEGYNISTAMALSSLLWIKTCACLSISTCKQGFFTTMKWLASTSLDRDLQAAA